MMYASNDYLIEEFINDDRYQIRQDGTIWFCYHKIWRQTGKAKTFKRGKIYFHLKYKKSNLLVHRIVFRKLTGPLDASLIINHIDGNSLNNTPINLELVTQQENVLHGKYA